MRRSTVALALLLLAPVASGYPSLARSIAPGAAPFNGLQLTLADFRGDGHALVVAQSDDGGVYVMDPLSGATLARFAPGNAGCTTACYEFEGVSGPINAPVVADVDGNGKLDVILADTAAVVARFEVDPARSTASSLAFVKVWEHHFNRYQSFTTMDATPVVAPLAGTGELDVIVATEEIGVYAIRPDGSTLWERAIASGHASPAVGDLDGDGHPEVVLANDAGVVRALDGRTGATRWTFDASAFLWPASVPAAPTIADVTGDGRPEILFGARDAHDTTDFTRDHAMLFALDAAGRLLWRVQPAWAAPLTHTRPIVVNVGGAPAILWGDWNTIGHKPGSFERVGPGHVALFDAQGRERWHRDLDAAASDVDLAVADLLGDGSQQVLAAGARNGTAGTWLFDLATGATRGFLATAAPTRSFAALADFAHDGRLAMAIAVGNGIVQVWTGSAGAASAFPGWGALVVPRERVPLASASPPAGFSATFSPKGNAWWVETGVRAAVPVAGVTAQVDGAPAVALPRTTWGTWAKSIHAPSGALVNLVARDAAGETASACYHWVTFAAASCEAASPPPAGNQTFTASFAPRNGNAWWVQVSVTASAPVARVEARVNGGAWQALALQSYGDWTRSMSAPVGSRVEFRATSTSGAVATSGAFTWPR